MTHTVPVICDRCRAEGVAGEADFADFGDLLDFEPVPLQVSRVDGYSPEAQRAFIAALSILGSAHRAARAIGKSATGAQRLRQLPGSEGFCRAWERAKAISQEKGTLRLANSLRAVAAPGAKPPPATGPEPPEPSEDQLARQDSVMLDLLTTLIHRYLIKLQQERTARLEGRIAEADLYVRQITWLEVCCDMLSGDGMRLLTDYRCRGHNLYDIVETPMTRLLDGARRRHWDAAGEPPRPEHPARHLLVEHDGFATEPTEYTLGGIELSHEEQRRRFEKRHAIDAAAQVAWEAEAGEAAAAWRARVEAEEAQIPLRNGKGDRLEGGGGAEGGAE